ncbi:MAG: hypothetical protein J6X18_06105, partial [Bacteroidales bacterium]|nr:hypothetical protein [Bacteroidales bacterium]
EEKVQKLNSLECEIVISSSWGEDGGKTLERLRAKGLTLPVIGYTEHYYNHWIVRGNEIKKWLEDNMKDEDYQYAILDDDSDMLLEQKEHFVQVDSYEALTDENVEHVRKILNSNIL